jgi:nucleotide-binding universal stress UspA family protein
MLLCLDLERGSDALARYAGARAMHCKQNVHVLYVHPKADNGPAWEDAQARLDRLVTANLADVTVEAVVIRHGLPEEMIVAYAKKYANDPVVLGRRQRSTIERIHVGSTTSAVISLATTPVLIVPVDFSENVS